MPEQIFTRGDRVRDTYNGRTGYITGRTRPYGDSCRWEVGFGDTEPEYIRETYLELISDDDDMVSLFKQCRFNGVLDLRRIIQQIRINGELSNLFYSMHNSSTKFMPHQFKPVMKFIESTAGRLLIADEVGLGKTIEAIYIWKELLTRENAKRFLIVCPAQLCQKWKDDLWRYFGIPSAIVGAKELLDRLKDTLVYYNSDNFVLITSIQGIRYKEQENTVSKSHNSRSRLNDFFEKFEADNNQELLDLVVIDEAHYLRNSATASYNTGEKLRDIARYMILLSATPIQTSSENFYNLLRLLSPEDFYNSIIFDELLTENRSIVALANAIRNNRSKKDIASLYNDVEEKIQNNTTLNIKILEYIHNPKNTDEERMALFQTIKDSSFYSQYFTRTRKRDVFENRIIRSAETLAYTFSNEEYNKYQEVTQYLKKLSINSPISKIFTLIARQRQMTSCLPAALKHWKDNDVMQDILYEDMGIDDREEYFDSGSNDIPLIETPDELIDRFTFNDSKYAKLVSAISQLLKENAQEKIIIFSYYRYTIHYLYSRLTEDGYICEKMMGGMGDDKYNVIERFMNYSNHNILISSEVGSEGIDLQFASIEINYDLPWNPMRLEQRIGRIDRIGQEKNKIRILNFICQNTIEDRVLERLYERIDIFKHSIGDIEEILGNQISQISIDLLTSNLNEREKQEKAFQKIDAIANNKIEMEKLEEQAGLSAEFSDIILENIKNADNNKRYIMAEELIQYTEDFFTVNYSGTRIEKNDNHSCTISLSAEAQMDFRDFIQVNRYHTANLGYRNDGVLCIFNGNRDLYKKWKNYELININHPFIKWMKNKNKDRTFSNYSCSAVKIRKEAIVRISKGIYVYYIQRWNTAGYRNTNELKYFVINTETNEFLDDNASEHLIINTLNNGIDYHGIEDDFENFDLLADSLDKCVTYACALFEKFERIFNEENSIICERNVQYLERTFERKKLSIKQQLETARQNRQAEKIIRMYKGKLSKAEEVYNIQLKKLQSKSDSSCNFSDIAIGIVKVED